AQAGRGVVVGVIDSGIRPEAASFQDRGHPAAPADWAGGCETGDAEAFPADSCNDKLIGAKYFVQGFGAARLAEVETVSPLDAGGHGTHTASTAAGNKDVTATVDGLERGTVSGMAPGAHVAAYKACWEGVTGGGCATSDTVAAIDAAVA
ncbi:S8 family serine peptidase, partial [Xanthomonas citri pv. citri]